MEKMKQIASVISDDLKDAQMLYDYAVKAKNSGDDSFAIFLISRAKNRLKMFDEAHQKAVETIKAEEKENGHVYAEGKWDCLHNYMIEQKKDLEYKITTL